MAVLKRLSPPLECPNVVRGVNRTDEEHETDDGLLVELHKTMSEKRVQPEQHAPNTRSILFMAAVMKRRGRQCLQRNVLQYIVCIDRWLVQSVRVLGYSNKKMGMLRLLLAVGLAFVLPYIALTMKRMHFSGRSAHGR